MITAYVWDISYDFVSYNFRLLQCTVVKIVFVLNNDFTKYIEKFKTFAISKIAKKSFNIVVAQTTQKWKKNFARPKLSLNSKHKSRCNNPIDLHLFPLCASS